MRRSLFLVSIVVTIVVTLGACARRAIVHSEVTEGMATLSFDAEQFSKTLEDVEIDIMVVNPVSCDSHRIVGHVGRVIRSEASKVAREVRRDSFVIRDTTSRARTIAAATGKKSRYLLSDFAFFIVSICLILLFLLLLHRKAGSTTL